MFSAITPLLFWAMALAWGVALAALLRRLKSLHFGEGYVGKLAVLIGLTSVAASITALYLAVWFSSRIGWFPPQIAQVLQAPEGMALLGVLGLISGVFGVKIVRGALPRVAQAGRDLLRRHEDLRKLVRENQDLNQVLDRRLEQYRSLYEKSNEVMLVVDPATGAIISANPAALKFYGYSMEEMQGMSITEINTMEAGDVAGYMQEARGRERNRFHFRHRLAGGEEREVEVASNPVEIDGKQLLVSWVYDVTERNRAQRELIFSQERFRLMLEQSPNAINLYNKDGLLVFGNQAWADLWQVEDSSLVIGKYNLLEDERASGLGVREAFLEALKGATVEVPEREFIPARAGMPGRPRFVRLKIYPLVNLDGSIQTVVVLVEDITELRNVREEREHQLVLQGVMEMAGAACHELNQPLQVLLSQVEILEMRDSADGGESGTLQRLRQELERLGRITQKIQNITRYETRDYYRDTRIIDIDRASKD